MVCQLGLDGYGVYEAIRLHRSGMSYVCGNLLPVFWVMFSLHIIQNCCNLGKFHKGNFVAKRSGRKGIEHDWTWLNKVFDSLTLAVKQLFHGVACPGLQHHPRSSEETDPLDSDWSGVKSRLGFMALVSRNYQNFEIQFQVCFQRKAHRIHWFDAKSNKQYKKNIK